MEDEAGWTAEGYKQPAYNDGSNVRRLDESSQPRQGHRKVRRNGPRTTGGNGAVLARGEMRRTVAVRFA